MAFIENLLREKCVYWAPSGRNMQGQQTFADPVQKNCRWEDGERLVVDNKTKQEILMSTTVFFVEGILPEGMLMYGELTDLDEESDDPYDNDAREIRTVFRTPSVDAQELLYEAILI